MNRRIHLNSFTGDFYEIHVRGATIVHIYRNRALHDTPYDDLPLLVREEILLAIINELAKD
jgi:hypothetical protein